MYTDIEMHLPRPAMVEAVIADYHNAGLTATRAGSGASADCVLTDRFAIKIMDTRDWCSQYYDLCAIHQNPHSPIVHDRVYGERTSIVILEKLYPAKLRDDEAWALSYYAGVGEVRDDDHAPEVLQPSMRRWLEIVLAERLRIRDSATDRIGFPSNDAHKGNWMRRMNGTLVLTDPWY